ncbi:uncharacterized protein VTP21DRAFT_11679 [Calcarisporiella thermophila]|uniref:uncharacterized protein n=1 Tax=Calcarisporiella thermophila TaxID=911321 RepID=UPI0037422122
MARRSSSLLPTESSENNKSGNERVDLAAIVIPLAIIAIILVGCMWYLLRKQRQHFTPSTLPVKNPLASPRIVNVSAKTSKNCGMLHHMQPLHLGSPPPVHISTVENEEPWVNADTILSISQWNEQLAYSGEVSQVNAAQPLTNAYAVKFDAIINPMIEWDETRDEEERRSEVGKVDREKKLEACQNYSARFRRVSY